MLALQCDSHVLRSLRQVSLSITSASTKTKRNYQEKIIIRKTYKKEFHYSEITQEKLFSFSFLL